MVTFVQQMGYWSTGIIGELRYGYKLVVSRIFALWGTTEPEVSASRQGLKAGVEVRITDNFVGRSIEAGTR